VQIATSLVAIEKDSRVTTSQFEPFTDRRGPCFVQSFTIACLLKLHHPVRVVPSVRVFVV
jgi:hypothetical protein